MNAALRVLAGVFAAGLVVPGQNAPEKVPIVSVAGCLAEQSSGTWMLTNAAEPEASNANAPPAGRPYTGPKTGKNTFRLIGVLEFDLPSRKGRNVLIKGLLIKATPVSRINLTSITELAASCPPPAK